MLLRSSPKTITKGYVDSHRIESLESLRGLAALTVCLFHAGAIKANGVPIVARNTWVDVVFNGHGAVILFFVLSGFVLRGALERTPTPRLRNFLVMRFFRLFPIVVFTVAAMAVVQWQFYSQTTGVYKFLRNALLLESTMVGPFWTLQVEVWGSALVLAAFEIERRFGTWPAAVLTGALIALSFSGDATREVPGIDTAFLYPFLVGYLLAAVRTPAFPTTGAAWVVLGIALATFYTAHAWGYVLKQWLLLSTVLAAGALVLVLREPMFRNTMQAVPLRTLGACSYSFYALHVFGIMAATKAADLGGGTIGTMLVAVGVTIVLAVPARMLIERSGIWLGRTITVGRIAASDVRSNT